MGQSRRSGLQRGARLGILLLVMLAAAVVVTSGIRTREKTAAAVKQHTLDLAVPVVSVIHPKHGALKDEVVLPGNIQAYTDSPIYARASGYLKAWHVDIGGRVKAGQLLAEIDAPELDQQVRQAQSAVTQSEAALEQARANLEQGKTNEQLARVTAQRWANLSAKGAVSKQENDQYQAQYQAQAANVHALEKAIAAAQSNVESARANLSRLKEMQAFEQVRAPFDGVVTARNIDVGALINAPTSMLRAVTTPSKGARTCSKACISLRRDRFARADSTLLWAAAIAFSSAWTLAA